MNAATDTRNLLAWTPNQDDGAVDYDAHTAVCAATWSLNLAAGGYTLTAPTAELPVGSHGPTVRDQSETLLTFKRVDEALACVPAGTSVRLHASAVAGRRVDAALRTMQRAGWTVDAVAWHRDVAFGKGVVARDLYMGVRAV